MKKYALGLLALSSIAHVVAMEFPEGISDNVDHEFVSIDNRINDHVVGRMVRQKNDETVVVRVYKYLDDYTFRIQKSVIKVGGKHTFSREFSDEDNAAIAEIKAHLNAVAPDPIGE